MASSSYLRGPIPSRKRREKEKGKRGEGIHRRGIKKKLREQTTHEPGKGFSVKDRLPWGEEVMISC